MYSFFLEFCMKRLKVMLGIAVVIVATIFAVGFEIAKAEDGKPIILPSCPQVCGRDGATVHLARVGSSVCPCQ
jgi:hypothetical protein